MKNTGPDRRVRSKKELSALSEQFRRALVATGWTPLEVRDELWQKDTNKLLLDEVGLFLFQLQDRAWVRTHGLCWDFIKACLGKFKDQQLTLWFIDGYTLVL